MATLRSVKSGRWSDPTTWDLGFVPADGDSVSIASGHQVTFDVDMSSFPNGLAGLTIDGTLKIPSKGEDPSVPDRIVLKVNANIAGSGYLIVGSDTNPITYPQTVLILVNGSINLFRASFYGEMRSPSFDIIAFDVPLGATTFQLTNGIPLRPGDRIVIGRSDVIGQGWVMATVQSYDADTKTVTIDNQLPQTKGGYPYGVPVGLLTRQIVISKYGSNSANLITGSYYILQGCFVTHESGATAGTACASLAATIRSSSFQYPSSSSALIGSSTLNVDDCVFAASTTFTSSMLSIKNSLCVGIRDAFSVSNAVGSFRVENVIFSNVTNLFIWAVTFTANAYVGTWINVSIKYVTNFVDHRSSTAPLYFRITGLLCVDCNYLLRTTATTVRPIHAIVLIVGAEFYVSQVNLNVNFLAAGGLLIIANAYAFVNGRYFYLANTTPMTIQLRSFTIRGSGTFYSFRSSDLVFDNLDTDIAPSLVYLRGRAFFRKFSAPSLPSSTPDAEAAGANPEFLFVEFSEFKVGGIEHKLGFRRNFAGGYVANRWDATPPDYSTFEFKQTSSTYGLLGKPIYFDRRFVKPNRITISGNLSVLSQNGVVKVQIFRSWKDPLLGDSPEFEQQFVTTGEIAINWTPPDEDEWIVRISAMFQASGDTAIIENLSIAGASGSEGSGLIEISVQDSANIIASESSGVQSVVSFAASDTMNISAHEVLEVPFQIEAQSYTSIQASDFVSVPLAVVADDGLAIVSSETINATFAASLSDNVSVAVTEHVSPEIAISASETEFISASEEVSSTIVLSVANQVDVVVNEVSSVGISMEIYESMSVTTEEQSLIGLIQRLVTQLELDVRSGKAVSAEIRTRRIDAEIRRT